MPIYYRLGDVVRIRSGPFASFTGQIEGINQAQGLLKVVVRIFGRATPVELSFADVDKISFADNSPSPFADNSLN